MQHESLHEDVAVYSKMNTPLPTPMLRPCGVSSGTMMACIRLMQDESPPRLVGRQGLCRFAPQSLTGLRLVGFDRLTSYCATASPEASQGYRPDNPADAVTLCFTQHVDGVLGHRHCGFGRSTSPSPCAEPSRCHTTKPTRRCDTQGTGVMTHVLVWIPYIPFPTQP